VARRHRDLFLLAGVVAVDPRLESLDVAMCQIEQAARNAVQEADQKVIGSRVDPADDGTAVTVDIRFRGGRQGAVAALEAWTNAVADLPSARRVLRTWLAGSDGLNLEWCDDEYQKELEARLETADEQTKQEMSARVPEERPRPSRRAWLTDWEEAARHPRKTLAFLAASFALFGLLIVALAGTPWWSSAVAAVVGAVIGVAFGGYGMRAMRDATRGALTDRDADDRR
jgi:hypothetical protein